jgi:hypothetical protein
MVVLLQSVFEREPALGLDARRIPARVKKSRQSLKPLAGVGVTYRQHEEAEAEGQHDDIQHEVLLVLSRLFLCATLACCRKVGWRWINTGSQVQSGLCP